MSSKIFYSEFKLMLPEFAGKFHRICFRRYSYTLSDTGNVSIIDLA